MNDLMKVVVWYTMGGMTVYENVYDIKGAGNGTYIELYMNSGGDVHMVNLADGSVEEWHSKVMPEKVEVDAETLARWQAEDDKHDDFVSRMEDIDAGIEAAKDEYLEMQRRDAECWAEEERMELETIVDEADRVAVLEAEAVAAFVKKWMLDEDDFD